MFFLGKRFRVKGLGFFLGFRVKGEGLSFDRLRMKVCCFWFVVALRQAQDEGLLFVVEFFFFVDFDGNF